MRSAHDRETSALSVLESLERPPREEGLRRSGCRSASPLCAGCPFAGRESLVP